MKKKFYSTGIILMMSFLAFTQAGMSNTANNLEHNLVKAALSDNPSYGKEDGARQERVDPADAGLRRADPLIIDITGTSENECGYNVNCNGNNGFVNILVSGGEIPYTFLWTGPGGFTATTQNISGLMTAGTYCVEVTDNSGNIAEECQTMTGDDSPPLWSLICETTYEVESCPDNVEVSISVGDEITVDDGWTVGNVTISDIALCVFDDCTKGTDLIIHVSEIIYSYAADSCNLTIEIVMQAEDECGNISADFVTTYHVSDHTAPDPPVCPDITIDCVLELASAETDTLIAMDDCQGPIIATATDTDNGGSGCGDDPLIITRAWTWDDDCGNAAYSTKTITVVMDPVSSEPEDCECDGGTNFLELLYSGPNANNLKVKDGNTVYFNGPVSTGDLITLLPIGNQTKLKKNLDFIIDGSLNAEIHTSCSQPIYIGLTAGYFEITDGASKNNGPFCPPESNESCFCPEEEEECQECEGGTILLEVVYSGPGGNLIVEDHGDEYFNGPVHTGDILVFVPLPGDFKLKNNLKFHINGSFNAQIHTSCSVPIGPGLVAGDFEITYAVSRNNGPMCPVPPPPPEDQDDCACEGGTIRLELRYDGPSGDLIIKDKNDFYFDGPVAAGDLIILRPLLGDNKIKNNLDLLIDGSLNAEIHTSCSVPIGIGFVYGDFEITFGESRNNGVFCNAAIQLFGEEITHETIISSNSYPNPFWNEVNISFKLPETADTRIEIMNINGQVLLVRELGIVEQDLTHNLEFNPKGSLPNGTYFYRITSGDQLSTGKMILMR